MTTADIDGLTEVNTALDGLVSAMSPAGRKKLGLRLGQLLRRENQRRIAANVSPDGGAFAPRLRQKGKKAKSGKMFKKLRQARHIRLIRSANEVRLEFSGQGGRVAAVHHFGLRDKVNKGKKPVHSYAARPLLGFSRQDTEALEMLILSHVTEALR
jgi:phage virion morphogenesis protein